MKSGGTTRPGPTVAMARVVTSAATIESAAAAINTSGNALTGKRVRKRASRAALLATWVAIIANAQTDATVMEAATGRPALDIDHRGGAGVHHALTAGRGIQSR